MEKEINEMINDVTEETWKAYRGILKGERGYKNKAEFLEDTFDFGCDDPYDQINWEAGYLSGLKDVLKLVANYKKQNV